jgi:hypothetical protein
MHVFIFVDGWEDMSSVQHHPSEPVISLLDFPDLADGGSDLGSHILLLLDDVLLPEFQLECHLAGIGLNSHVSAEEGETVEYLGNC